MKWEAFQDLTSKASLDAQLSNFIRITTRTIQIEVKKGERQKHKDRYTAKVNLEDGGHVLWKFDYISKVHLSKGQQCTGIILGHSLEDIKVSFRPTGPAILVVCKIGDTTERVGFGWVDQFYSTRYDKNNICDTTEDEAGYLLLPNPMYLEPLGLVSSWKEIRLG